MPFAVMNMWNSTKLFHSSNKALLRDVQEVSSAELEVFYQLSRLKYLSVIWHPKSQTFISKQNALSFILFRLESHSTDVSKLKELGGKACKAVDVSRTSWNILYDIYVRLHAVQKHLLSCSCLFCSSDVINSKLEEILASLKQHNPDGFMEDFKRQ